MSVIKKPDDGRRDVCAHRKPSDQEAGEKHVPHLRHEHKEVWKILYEWAGEHDSDESEQRWKLLCVVALIESANWQQAAAAMALGISQGRVSQILAEARRVLPAVFEEHYRKTAVSSAERLG